MGTAARADRRLADEISALTGSNGDHDHEQAIRCARGQGTVSST